MEHQFLKSKYYPVSWADQTIINDPQTRERDCFSSYGLAGRKGSKLNDAIAKGYIWAKYRVITPDEWQSEKTAKQQEIAKRIESARSKHRALDTTSTTVGGVSVPVAKLDPLGNIVEIVESLPTPAPSPARPTPPAGDLPPLDSDDHAVFDAYIDRYAGMSEKLADAQAEIALLRGDNERLAGALKPFAVVAAEIKLGSNAFQSEDSPVYALNGVELTVAHFRAAAHQPPPAAPASEPVISINGVPMTSEQATEYVADFAVRSGYGHVIAELEQRDRDAQAEIARLRTALYVADEALADIAGIMRDNLDNTPPEFSVAWAVELITDIEKRALAAGNKTASAIDEAEDALAGKETE